MKKFFSFFAAVLMAVVVMAEPSTSTWTMNTDAGIKEITVTKQGAPSTGGELELTKNGIIVTSATAYFKGSGSDGIQIYKTGTLTITAPAGNNITSIVFQYPKDCYPFAEALNKDGSATTKTPAQVDVTWTAETPANSFTFTNVAVGQTKVKKLVITYEEATTTGFTLSMAKTEEAITITPSDLNAKYYVAVLDPSIPAAWAFNTKEQNLALYANVIEGIENQAALEAKLIEGVETITLADYTAEGSYTVLAGAMHYAGDVEGNINGFIIDSEVAVETFTIEKQVVTTTFSFADGEQGVVTITPSNNSQNYIYVYYNDNLKTLLRGMSEEDLIDFILGSAEDLSPIMLKGVQTVDIAEYAGLEEFGLSLPNGTYNLLVAAVEYDEEEEYYSIVGDIARHEDVVLEVEFPEFKGNPDFQKKGFSVKGIEEFEDYFVSYMLDVESYEQYSTQYSDEDMLNLTLGLPDSDGLAYKTAGEVVRYDQYEYFIDAEATENANYVILIANADVFATGKVSSKAVKYYVTLSPEGELVSTPTGINNAEVENLGKMIVNGELVIVKDGVRYNVLGARK